MISAESFCTWRRTNLELLVEAAEIERETAEIQRATEDERRHDEDGVSPNAIMLDVFEVRLTIGTHQQS